MVKGFLSLLLLSSFSLNAQQIPRTVEEGLRHLSQLKDTEDFGKWYKEAEITLNQEIVEHLALKLKERDKAGYRELTNTLMEKYPKGITPNPETLEILARNNLDETKYETLAKNLMEKYPQEIRQDILNSLLKPTDYKTLIGALNETESSELSEKAFPTFSGGLALVDWISMTVFPDSENPEIQSILVNGGFFNTFNTLSQFHLFIEPYGNRASIRLDQDALCFDLQTIGGVLGAGYAFTEKLEAYISLGYSHSSAHWKETSDTVSLHSLFFQPSIAFLLPKGFLAAKILGGVNFYSTQRKTILFPEKTIQPKDATSSLISWDILGRLKGGFSLPIGASFYLFPYATIDYGTVFLPAFSETLDKNTSLHINPLKDSFLRLALNAKLSQAKFRKGFGFIIPSLCIGWIKNLTLAYSNIDYKLEGCTESIKKNIEIESWEQLAFGVGLTLLHIRGIVASFDYQFSKSPKAQMHFGSLRIGLTW